MVQTLSKGCVTTLTLLGAPNTAKRTSQARLNCNRKAPICASMIGRSSNHPCHHSKMSSSATRLTQFSNAVCSPAKSCGSPRGCRMTSTLPRTASRCPFDSQDLINDNAVACEPPPCSQALTCQEPRALASHVKSDGLCGLFKSKFCLSGRMVKWRTCRYLSVS